MRTTLVLDEDIYEVAAARARLHRISLGKAVSELARRSLGETRIVEDYRGFPVLQAPAGSPRITSERIKELIERTDTDEAASALGR
jgi:hypothetical protein